LMHAVRMIITDLTWSKKLTTLLNTFYPSSVYLEIGRVQRFDHIKTKLKSTLSVYSG
jgi:hypothetical protein